MMNLREDETVFVIGGAKVLWGLRPQINRVYLTRHRCNDRADVTLNTRQYLEGYELVEQEQMDELVFEIYQRV